MTQLTSDASHIRQWLVSRAGAWRSVVQHVAALRAQRHATVDEALSAVETYRGLARDLATARRLAPNSRTAAGLESLYRQMHTLISRRPHGGWQAVRIALSTDIPNVTRALRIPILSMAVLMTVSAFAGWWLISTFPTL